MTLEERIKELEDRLIQQDKFYRDSLSNIRWILSHPRNTLDDLKSQIGTADLFAKKALEGKFFDDQILKWK